MCSSNNRANPSHVLEAPLRGAGELVTELVPMDVLCGKSRKCITHEGTRLFREIIDQYRDRYEQTKSKQDRMNITKEIVAYIHQNGGRFLKFNSSIECWENIGALAARDKVSHALRCASQKVKNTGRRSPSSRQSRSPSIASDATSLASRTGSRADLTSPLRDTGISESLETVIGDQQSVLSCFSSPQGLLELPTADSLTSIFENEAHHNRGSHEPSAQSGRNPFLSNGWMETAESLLPTGWQQQSDASTHYLPLGRINLERHAPSPEEELKETEKSEDSFFPEARFY